MFDDMDERVFGRKPLYLHPFFNKKHLRTFKWIQLIQIPTVKPLSFRTRTISQQQALNMQFIAYIDSKDLSDVLI